MTAMGTQHQLRLLEPAAGSEKSPTPKRRHYILRRAAKRTLRATEAVATVFVLTSLGPVILSLHAAKMFHEWFLDDGNLPPEMRQ